MTYYRARACVIRSYVIRAGGHLYTLYTYLYTCNDPPKSLNGTLAVNLPFQTHTVDFESR